ncbi:hypothetical protein F0562_010560 [Nyssa sinensis]|uniref:Pentacotripeptide-repeat region of PRORP domain-containing protein n=1 Tax=Nyssa sinensis TaxID=561372 RepID=A0A5J5A139_9ASTE|nr:hypothetical protein F0562_010560 [Nyssa sinensis]
MFAEMEQIVEQLKQETRFVPKEIIFCNIMNFYGRARLPDRAIFMFDQMSSFRCQRTVKSVNALLNSLLICREFGKMKEIFVGIDQYACPDVCTYNILINARCLSNDLDGAWNVFDEMRRKGIWPNEVTFGTLINALCANLELDKALRLKIYMVEKFNVKPNAFVYVSLMKGLCKVNKLNLAIKLKEEMLENKLALDAAVYSTLISALFKVGRKGEVIGVLEEMRENGCKPDTVTYNAMISGFCKEKDFDSAFCVLNEMEEKGCKPDVISYNVIICEYCKEGKYREANELFEDMPRRMCPPDVVTYRILFDGLCEGMQFREATFILDEMIFKGYAPRAVSIYKFVDGLFWEADVEAVWTVLNSLAKGNIIDVDTWRMWVSVPFFVRHKSIVAQRSVLLLSKDEAASRSFRGLGKLLSMEKIKKAPSLEDSLILSALPKGVTPPSSPSGKGHEMAINEKLFTLHLAHIDRILQSFPSPGIGN